MKKSIIFYLRDYYGWLGLRVNMVILKSNGAKISIMGNDRSKCESFIQDLVRINKSIVVKS